MNPNPQVTRPRAFTSLWRSLLFATATLLIPVTPAMANCPDDALSAYYQFNGNANDLISGVPLTASGAVTYVGGVLGQSVWIDGPSSGRLTGAGTSAWDIAPSGFTFEAWVKVTSLPGLNPRIVLASNSPDGSFNTWQLLVRAHPCCGTNDEGIVQFTINDITPGVLPADVRSITKINDGVPHHIAATYDGAELRLYLDGILEGTTSAANYEVHLSGGTVAFGNNFFSGADQFDGWVDEARIWKIARSAGQIQADMLREIQLGPCPLVATVDLDPNTLNRGSNGKWVTAYIELDGSADVADIDIATVRLEGTIAAAFKPAAIGDLDEDLVPELMVKFPRASLDYLSVGMHTLKVSGSLLSGETFEGSDDVTVIDPPTSTAMQILSPAGRIPVEYQIQSDRPQVFRISVMDVQGRRISEWTQDVAQHSRGSWGGRDAGGSPVRSGVYFMRIEGDREVVARKVTVVR